MTIVVTSDISDDKLDKVIKLGISIYDKCKFKYQNFRKISFMQYNRVIIEDGQFNYKLSNGYITIQNDEELIMELFKSNY